MKLAPPSPSSAARRIACPGSYEMEQRYPRGESPRAEEGKIAHELAASYLQYELWKIETPELEKKYNITDAMRSGARLYSDTITKVINNESKNIRVAIEETIPLKFLHPEAQGRPDCILITEGKLYVFEYKFGHRHTSSSENAQLIEYAMGFLERNTLTFQWTPLEIIFCVIQPNVYTHRRVETANYSIEQFQSLVNWIRESETKAQEKDAPLTPGSECYGCNARHACPALRDTVNLALSTLDKTIPFELNSNQTGQELKVLQDSVEFLKARITGLEAQAIAMIKMGERVPGYRLSSGIKREAWSASVEKIIALGNLLDVDLRKPQSVITPKQAVDAGIPENLVKKNTFIPSGELKLVRDSGKMFS